MRPNSAAPVVSLPGGRLRHDGTCVRDAQLRPLTGRDEDWLLSLDTPWPQAVLVTELLARCVERIGPEPASREMVCSLLVGDRDFLLLRLHEISFGPRVELVRACPHAECGAKMDVDFNLATVPVEETLVRSRYEFEFGEAPRHKASFRLPEGADQEAVCQWSGLAADDMTTRLLARCLVELDGKSPVGPVDVQALSPEARTALEHEIERCSPKVHFEMEATCPQCGRAFSSRVDPASFLFQALLGARADFVREVHLLAFHYHWSLREILELSRPRRRRYLGTLVSQLDRAGDMTFVAA